VDSATERGKNTILSVGSIIVEDKHYELKDYSRTNVTSAEKKSGKRVSIHGIPFSVPDSEIEQFVDT